MYNKFIILLLGYLIVAVFGWVIKVILQFMKVTPPEESIKFKTVIKRGGVSVEKIEERGIKGGGFLIGLFERILIFSFVLTNQYAAISIIFAAKSLARFKELDNRNIAEYYLLGTFISITFAVVLGIIFVMMFGYV